MKHDITKRYKGVDERMATINTLVAIVVDKRVSGRAAVAQWLVLLIVMERLGPDLESC